VGNVCSQVTILIHLVLNDLIESAVEYAPLVLVSVNEPELDEKILKVGEVPFAQVVGVASAGDIIAEIAEEDSGGSEGDALALTCEDLDEVVKEHWVSILELIACAYKSQNCYDLGGMGEFHSILLI
jgi:hypothetical protein